MKFMVETDIYRICRYLYLNRLDHGKNVRTNSDCLYD